MAGFGHKRTHKRIDTLAGNRMNRYFNELDKPHIELAGLKLWVLSYQRNAEADAAGHRHFRGRGAGSEGKYDWNAGRPCQPDRVGAPLPVNSYRSQARHSRLPSTSLAQSFNIHKKLFAFSKLPVRHPAVN
jgi:hypothetical protein